MHLWVVSLAYSERTHIDLPAFEKAENWLWAAVDPVPWHKSEGQAKRSWFTLANLATVIEDQQK